LNWDAAAGYQLAPRPAQGGGDRSGPAVLPDEYRRQRPRLQHRGGVVQLSAAPGAEETVVIRVADNGPGIPREIRSRVFEPGFSTKKSGWGIGLSLAKRIVEENHGGKLTLASSEQGAAFEIILH